MAEVTLERISKVFPNGIRAVDDLSVEVLDGELVVVVGPSACGKTTTLRLIAGLEEPTAGRVFIGGRDVSGVAPRDRDLAFAFQRPALYPNRTVRRNLSFGLEMRHKGRWFGPRRGEMSRAVLRQRVIETARILDLERELDHYPQQLSGGQQQRVALGRAIALQPGVFLLDEPFSQLDAQLRAEIRHELHLLQRRLRTTMVYVTHDQAEAMALADRVVVLNRGVLQQVGSPEHVYKRPRNRWVAGFLGWPTMNFLEGHLEQSSVGIWFRSESLGLKLAAENVPETLAMDKVTLGLRPEAVQPAAPGETAAGVASVVLVETLGRDWLAVLDCQGWRLTACFSNQARVENGQQLRLKFDMAQAHWFHAISGEALGRVHDSA
jgi:multiple sugar transport system ATP-binding protein